MKPNVKRQKGGLRKIHVVLAMCLTVLLFGYEIGAASSSVQAETSVAGAAEQVSSFSPTAPTTLPQRDPAPFYTEDFENMGTNSPAISLENYVGQNGIRYTATPQWLDNTDCNGLLVKYTDTDVACPSTRGGENNVRRLSDVLGQHELGALGGTPFAPINASSAQSQANHALSEFTLVKDVDYSGTMFRTLSDITLKTGAFVTAAVDIAETSCLHLGGKNNSKLNFFLLSAGNQIPLQSTPIHACEDPTSQAYTSPDLPGGWAGGGNYVNVGTYYSNGSILLSPGSFGLSLESATASFDGNDAALDNIRLVDATPTLSKSFSDPDASRTSTLTFTVTNTSENAAKSGWSFDDQIDSRLVIDTANAATTCANGAVSFTGQTMHVSGDLAAGQASCEITVPVTAPGTGNYTNCPDINVKNIVGLLGPECAILYVGNYTVDKSSNPAKGTALVSGQTVTYTLTIRPTADSPTEAVIPAVIEDSMTGVLDDATYNNDIVASAGSVTVKPGGDISWTGNVTGGTPVTITYSATVKSTPTGGDNSLINVVVRDGESPITECDPTIETCTVHPVLVPGLAVSKTATPSSGTTVNRGSTVSYSVVAENTGETDLTSVTLTDDLTDVLDDADIVSGSLVSSVGNAPVFAGSDLSWVGDLAKGQKVTLGYTVTVKTDSIAASTLVNKVKGSATGPGDTDVPSNCVAGTEPECSTAHPIDALTPGLIVSKSADPVSGTEIKRGSTVTYTVTAENTGQTALSNTTITDDLSDVLDNADMVSGSLKSSVGNAPELNGSILSWVGDLAAGQKVELSYAVKVKSDFSQIATLLNTVTAVGTAPGNITVPSNCVTGSEPGCTTTHPVPATSVTIEKSDGKLIVGAGEELVYDVTVTNTGSDEVTKVVATDSLPTGLTFVTASNKGTFDSATRTVTWAIGSIPVGEKVTVQVTATVDQDVRPGAEIRNTATVETEQGCVDNPATAGDECTTTDVDYVPSLKVVKNDHKQVVAPGQAVTYDITASNTGVVEATEVVVTDELPQNLVFLSADQGGVFDEATRKITWNIPTIASGDAVTVHAEVSVADSVVPGDTIRNLSTITSPVDCVDDVRTPENDCESIDIDDVPQISVTKTDNKDVVLPGEASTYELVVTNKGKADAPSVVLVDTLPSNLTFQSATGSGTFDPNSNTVRWDLGTLAAGETRTLTVDVTVSASAVPNEAVSNNAKVSTDEICVDDPATEQNECDVTDIDRMPAVSIIKDDEKTIVKPGENVVYALTASNTSDYDAPNVIVRDVLPPNVRFLESSLPGTQSIDNAAAFEWDLGTLKSGESKVILVTVIVDEDLPADTQVLNTATITTNNVCLDDPTTERTECESTDVDRTPSHVWILKDDHEGSITPGAELVYDLTVGNDSETLPVTDVIVTDELPHNVEFISATEGGVYDEVTRTVTWKFAELAVSERKMVQVTVVTHKDLVEGENVKNSAIVRTPEGCIDEESCESIDIDNVPNVSIVKDDHEKVVTPGQSLTYELTAENLNDSIAREVSVTDQLPAHLSFVSASDSGQYDPGSRAVTWDLGTLSPGEKRVVSITVTVDSDASGDIANIATITTDKGCSGEGCTSTDTDTLSPTGDYAKLALTGGDNVQMLLVTASLLLMLAGISALVTIRRRVTRQ